jgi:hypothetical protein
MKETLFRLLDALGFALSFAFLGATLGIGCYFLHPAQYRSTVRIFVDDRATADTVRAAALSPAAASAAIIAADLFHSERKTHDLAAVVNQLRRECFIGPASPRGLVTVELAVTYRDAALARKAAEAIVSLVTPAPPRYILRRPWGFPPPPPSAAASVRASGFEPGASLTLGLILGLLVHSVLMHFQYAAQRARNSPAGAQIKLRFLYR